jgi:hypothetical protein
MSFSLKSIRSRDGIDFDRNCLALVEWLRKHWDIKAEPRCPEGYVGARETYRDFDEMDSVNETELVKEFCGHDAGGTVSFPFPINVSLPHVLYNDTNRGISPFQTMVGAIMRYGMLLGERLAEVDESSEQNHKLFLAKHAFAMYRSEEDPELQITYEMEIDEYLNKSNTLIRGVDISNKWDRKRSEIESK